MTFVPFNECTNNDINTTGTIHSSLESSLFEIEFSLYEDDSKRLTGDRILAKIMKLKQRCFLVAFV